MERASGRADVVPARCTLLRHDEPKEANVRRLALYAVFGGILGWLVYRDVADNGFAPAVARLALLVSPRCRFGAARAFG
jgi:hypothetical protein